MAALEGISADWKDMHGHMIGAHVLLVMVHLHVMVVVIAAVDEVRPAAGNAAGRQARMHIRQPAAAAARSTAGLRGRGLPGLQEGQRVGDAQQRAVWRQRQPRVQPLPSLQQPLLRRLQALQPHTDTAVDPSPSCLYCVRDHRP